MAFFTKIWSWILTNGASILGIAQAILKSLKEIFTAVINIISIFMPQVTAQDIVVKIRDIMNMIDAAIEKAKLWLLEQGGLDV